MTSTPIFRRILVIITFLILISVASLAVWIHFQYDQKENTLITTKNTSLTNNTKIKNIHNNKSYEVFNSNNSFKNTSDNIKLEIPEITLKNNDNQNKTKSTQKTISSRLDFDEYSNEDNNALLEPIEPIDSNNNNNETFKSNHENTEIEIQLSESRNDTESFPITITPIIDNSKNIPDDKIILKEEVYDNIKCFGELGCLNVTKEWINKYATNFWNSKPYSRKVINTTFQLYTRKNPTQGQTLNNNGQIFVKQLNFDPKQGTKFIIHGFLVDSSESWIHEMKDELLKYDNYNIIIVDYLSATFYGVAFANIRIVSLEIAYLINHLHLKYGLKLDDVHLIGHSLGAHIAGFAGAKLQGEIGRISGLDPASFFFWSADSSGRLDFSDAKFVDVIHSGTDKIITFGIDTPSGHLDFYTNMGDNNAAKCWKDSSNCNHENPIIIFIESINSECQFTSYKCINYENFINSECFSHKNNESMSYGIMGFHADKSPALKQKSIIDKSINNSSFTNKFFIIIDYQKPLCRTQYRIKIKIAKLNKTETSISGRLNVTLYGENKITIDLQFTKRLNFYYGETTTLIATPIGNVPYDLGKIWKIKLEWSCFYLNCDDSLYVEKIIVDKPEIPIDERISKRYFSSTLYSTKGYQNYTKISTDSNEIFIDNNEKYKDTHLKM